MQPYEGSARYQQAACEAGLLRAAVCSSTNCRDVLAAAGIEDLFEQVIGGVAAEREHLRNKPAPGTFLAAAGVLGVEPTWAAGFGDTLAVSDLAGLPEPP